MQIEIVSPVKVVLVYEDSPELQRLRSENQRLKSMLSRYDYAFADYTVLRLRLGRAKRILRSLGANPDKYHL